MASSSSAQPEETIAFATTEEAITHLVRMRDSAEIPTTDSEIPHIRQYLKRLQAITLWYNAQPKAPFSSAPPITLFANEIRFADAADATAHLTLANTRQVAAGISNESQEELRGHIQDAGRLSDAIPHKYQAKANNFVLLCAQVPTNYTAAKRDGWFVELGDDEAVWREMHHDQTVPHHTLAVKIADHTMWVYDPAFVEFAGAKRLTEMSGWALVRTMRKGINKKYKNISKVYVGGGDNEEGLCREMSCRWLVNEVIRTLDPESEAALEIVPPGGWHQIQL